MAPWSVEIWRLTGTASAALVAGWLAGEVWIALAVGVSGFIAWHAFQVTRLYRWLTVSRRAYPPEAGGIWGEIYYRLYQSRRRSRQREQRLAAIIREFRRSTEAMPDGTVVLSPDGRILWFNPAAARLLKLRHRDDVGQHVANLIRHPDFVAYFSAAAFAEPLEIDSPFHPDVRLGLQVIPYGEAQSLLMIHDLTRLHRLERIRRDFVANASHELRSPLTVIAGYLEAMCDDVDSAPAVWSGPIDKMRTQLRRMEKLLDDLLMLSMLDAQPEPETNAPVDVAALVAEICRDGKAVPRADLYLGCALDGDLMLEGAEFELRSAFSNLIQNAVKYSPDGGEIRIRWYRDGDTACFSVEDQGIGISAKHVPRLTERFYRVDAGRSREQGGTGLGLSIVKHALARHGAVLEVDSIPGQGSTFRCRFPPERLRQRGTGRSAAENC